MRNPTRRILLPAIVAALPGLSPAAGVTVQTTGVTFPDGTIQTTAATAAPGQIAWVATSGGDYTSPLDALDDLATWCGTPDAGNPCVIRIAPGVFDLGNTPLQMVPFVRIEGSGVGTTIITGAVSSSATGSWATSALVLGADNAELAGLSVTNTGGSTYSVAIYNNAAAPTLREVAAHASGAIHNFGIFNETASPELIGVTATASADNTTDTYAHAIRNLTGASPTLIDTEAHASGAMINYGVNNSNSSHPQIHHSRILGSVINDGSSTAKIAGSQITGGINVGAGISCVGDYNSTFTALDESCLVP